MRHAHPLFEPQETLKSSYYHSANVDNLHFHFHFHGASWYLELQLSLSHDKNEA